VDRRPGLVTQVQASRQTSLVTGQLRTLGDLLRDADALLRRGDAAAPQVWASGLASLDRYLSGGLRSGELTLLGGPQGVGKTSLALQMLRNVVAAGGTGVYFSFEHDPATVLQRLLVIEAGDLGGLDGPTFQQVRETMENADHSSDDLPQRLALLPGGTEAVDALVRYADRVLVHGSSGGLTDLAEIARVCTDAAERTGQKPFVVVDYLQKVAVPHGPEFEHERVTLVVDGLKNLALQDKTPVLAVVAADTEGIVSGRRMRVHHLRGSSALAYEADVVLLLNDKFDVVARHHLVYDLTNVERFRDWVVLTIEKNRSGLDGIDLEFRKRLDQARFEADGRLVQERLVDDRVFVE
jgi:replicative DNA helicase